MFEFLDKVNPFFVNLATKCFNRVLVLKSRNTFNGSSMSYMSRILLPQMDHGDVQRTDVYSYRHFDGVFNVVSWEC